MSEDTRHVVNDLMVDLFRDILEIEEKYHRFHGVELSMTEIHTLDSIYKSQSKRMSDVALDLNITQGSLTSTIDRLEEKKYVSRIKDQKDRRIYRLHLEAKSIDVLKVHQKFHEDLVDAIMLEVKNNDQLIASIKNLSDFFNKIKEV